MGRTRETPLWNRGKARVRQLPFPNPFLNLMLASTYPGRPNDALTREEAITAYTATAAYAEFKEHEKGTLESGKLADIAVLSQDALKASALPP
jgi:predicted amidohydrolase YtcJ